MVTPKGAPIFGKAPAHESILRFHQMEDGKLRIQMEFGDQLGSWMEFPTAELAWAAVDEFTRQVEIAFGRRAITIGDGRSGGSAPPPPKHQTVRSGVKFPGVPVANKVDDGTRQISVQAHIRSCTKEACAFNDDEWCPMLRGGAIADPLPAWPHIGEPYTGYLGPIARGMIFDWERHKPHAYERVLVVGIDCIDGEERAIYTIDPRWPETSSRPMIDNLLPRSKWNNPRIWNEEGRFREAVWYVRQTRLA